MNYYDRKNSINSDGTPLFSCDYDKENQVNLVKLLENKWKCTIKSFGRLCPIDYFALKDGRLAGFIEIKSRSHTSDKYKTIFLNFRKWIALSMASISFGSPGIFVVKFIDKIKYINISDIDTKELIMGGTKNIVKSHTDIEPMIHIDISKMKDISGKK